MRTRKEGFTLAEVLIAVLIVGIGVLGLIGTRIYALKGSQGAPDHQTASLMAASLIAEVEDRLQQGLPVEQVEDELNATPAGNPKFSHSVQLRRDSDMPEPNEGLDNLLHVDVEVTWENRGRQAVYRLHTRLAQL